MAIIDRKRHRRWRRRLWFWRLCFWSMVAGVLFTVGLWLLTLHYQPRILSTRGELWSMRGAVHVAIFFGGAHEFMDREFNGRLFAFRMRRLQPAIRSGQFGFARDYGFIVPRHWNYYMPFPAEDVVGFIVPLWLPLALFLLAVGLALWRLRHAARPPSVCEACGYDLTGNESGQCPECGKPIAAANSDSIAPSRPARGE